ncbi:hypothetical protein [Alteraurantiacibacter aquimixticola]|uniref:hypothetical protein n=1 Tax=Alteraurantiacibacter aquimixticola TaxID=2489173 RepID=UPI0010A9F940|nr:hypothetical protein [Alteraurantiacibacter aquimixticola]
MDTYIEEVWPKTDAEYPPNLNQTLRFFVGAMQSRARASFLLLQANSYWESEIVLRSLLEAVVKCLTFARRKDVDALLEQFWVELQASSDRKTALKAAMAQELMAEGSEDHSIFADLQNPEWFSIEPASNKQRRRSLDHQWSLPELVRKLMDESETTEPVAGLDAMLHSYGLQSEITHVSSKYYDLLWDRMIRGAELEALEDTHYCRQMTDALFLTAFSIVLSLQRLNVDKAKLNRPIEIAEKFSKLAKPYREEFARIRRPD